MARTRQTIRPGCPGYEEVLLRVTAAKLKRDRAKLPRGGVTAHSATSKCIVVRKATPQPKPSDTNEYGDEPDVSVNKYPEGHRHYEPNTPMWL
jgi:hypothetical protein